MGSSTVNLGTNLVSRGRWAPEHRAPPESCFGQSPFLKPKPKRGRLMRPASEPTLPGLPGLSDKGSGHEASAADVALAKPSQAHEGRSLNKASLQQPLSSWD